MHHACCIMSHLSFIIYHALTSTTRSQVAVCISILLLGGGITLGRCEIRDIIFFQLCVLHDSYLLYLFKCFFCLFLFFVFYSFSSNIFFLLFFSLFLFYLIFFLIWMFIFLYFRFSFLFFWVWLSSAEVKTCSWVIGVPEPETSRSTPHANTSLPLVTWQ